ncbi:hypothetical protein HKX48_005826 [Thoreauomyces humboldtii]|nr:hypothetical protein HKX48_005826 [Thoreauomyces humboldtii]
MEHMEQHRTALRDKVQPIMQTDTLRDPASGTLFLQIPVDSLPVATLRKHWIINPYIADQILSHCIAWASPFRDAPPAGVAAKFRAFISAKLTPSNAAKKRKQRGQTPAGAHIENMGHGVLVCPPRKETGEYVWILGRARLAQTERVPIPMKIGGRAMWDGRFYIRLFDPATTTTHDDADERTFHGVPTSALNFVVRAFTFEDYKSILHRISTAASAPPGTSTPSFHPSYCEQVRNVLQNYWSKMPEQLRETIPCVALQQDNGDTSYVVCVPSLAINLEPGLLDCRFSFANHTRFDQEPLDVGFSMPSEQ